MITRRGFMVLAGGSLAASAARAQLPPNVAVVRKAALEEAIRRFTAGAPVRVGRVKLDVPPLVENGNSVLISVRVDSPMTPADHVRTIQVFAEKNPQPNVIAAHLGPRAGRAAISVRARIADTGDVIAIAQLSDGTFWSDSARPLITLSACLEDGLI